MQRLSRIVLVALWTLIGLAAIVLLVANLYVQSQETQTRIQRELSQRLGTPLHIRSISITPWGGLTLSGITIPQTSSAVSTDFLKAKSFHLHVRLSSLFSQRLIIKQVSLLGPTVVWPQDQNGKWRLPGAHSAENVAPTSTQAAPVTSLAPLKSLTGPPSTAPQVSSFAPSPAGTTSETEAEVVGPSFTPEVRRFSLTGGNFHFLDRSGSDVATFEGVRFHSRVRNSQAVLGTVRVAKISLHNRFFVQELESFLHYDPLKLELPKVSARSCGGELRGAFSMAPGSEGSPFTANVNFRGVEAEQVLAEAGGPKDILKGKLEGNMEASGKAAEGKALTGQGTIVLHDGKVQQYSLLVALGQILQIEELTQLQLQQAEVKYRLKPGMVTIDQLVLRSPNIRLSATGTVDFDGKLDLKSQLAINEKVRSQLFKPIRDNFEPIAEQGYSAVNFSVGGTVDRPRTNLMEKVVGRDLQDFVSGLFGGKPHRKKKKKGAEAEASAAPSREASPGESADSRPAETGSPP